MTVRQTEGGEVLVWGTWLLSSSTLYIRYLT